VETGLRPPYGLQHGIYSFRYGTQVHRFSSNEHSVPAPSSNAQALRGKVHVARSPKPLVAMKSNVELEILTAENIKSASIF
jgi:hypothetical protein